MSSTTETNFKCDNCDKEQEVKGTNRPNDWVLFNVETKSGRLFYGEFEVCGECAETMNRDKNKKMFKNIFKSMNRIK